MKFINVEFHKGILFIIYINDITLFSYLGKFICFSDDIVVLFSDEYWTETYEKA